MSTILDNFITENNIPCKRDMKICKKNRDPFIKFDYILPGCVIILATKSLNKYDNFIKRIINILNILPDYILLYIFNDSGFVFEQEHDDVIVITDTKDIEINKCIYAFFSPHTLRYLTDNEEQTKYINNIYMPRDLYDHSSCIYEDMSKIDKYYPSHVEPDVRNTTIIVITSGNSTMLPKNKYKNIEKLFCIFHEPHKRESCEVRKPIRHLEGTTKKCDICGVIYLLTYSVNQYCVFCKRNKKNIRWFDNDIHMAITNKTIRYDKLC